MKINIIFLSGLVLAVLVSLCILGYELNFFLNLVAVVALIIMVISWIAISFYDKQIIPNKWPYEIHVIAHTDRKSMGSVGGRFDYSSKRKVNICELSDLNDEKMQVVLNIAYLIYTFRLKHEVQSTCEDDEKIIRFLCENLGVKYDEYITKTKQLEDFGRGCESYKRDLQAKEKK